MQNLYLCHHGVKGMKWGVRKGPPYPLGSGGKPNPFNTKLSSISKTAIDVGKTAVGQALNGDPLDYGIKNPNAYNVIMDWYEDDSDHTDDALPAMNRAFGGYETEALDSDLNNYAYERFTGDKQGLKLTPTQESVYNQVLDPDSPLYERSEWEREGIRSQREKAWREADWDKYEEMNKRLDEIDANIDSDLNRARDEARESRQFVQKLSEGIRKSSEASYENIRPFAEEIISAAFESNAPKLNHEESSDEATKAINPKYGQTGYDENCTGCSAAFDMRKRGYDVTAGEYLSGGLTDEKVASTFYKNAPGFTSVRDPMREYLNSSNDDDSTKQKTAGRILDEAILESTPDGGRGMLHGNHYITNGLTSHSVAYEVVDGSVKYHDGQTGKSYDNGYDMVENEKFYYDTCRFMRVDNLEPNWLELGKNYRIGRKD